MQAASPGSTQAVFLEEEGLESIEIGTEPGAYAVKARKESQNSFIAITEARKKSGAPA